MPKWEDHTEDFLEESRHYRNKYLEICEVYDDKVEVSLFSSLTDPWEIYFSYDIFFGIIYTDEASADTLRAAIKEELEEEYNKNEAVTDEFINYFGDKYKVELPNDILFDPIDIFNLFNL